MCHNLKKSVIYVILLILSCCRAMIPFEELAKQTEDVKVREKRKCIIMM